ncbi:MAG: hypothetical protein OEL87_00860 [Nanoarchaeota archaeon]|nr:hypothetical protein [Nanoarchaeota archaeon]
MENGRELYVILREMVSKVKEGRVEDVSRLNDQFEGLFSINLEARSEDEILYDNCRQSCVMAGQMPMMSPEFVRDAEKKYSEISRMNGHYAI